MVPALCRSGDAHGSIGAVASDARRQSSSAGESGNAAPARRWPKGRRLAILRLHLKSTRCTTRFPDRDSEECFVTNVLTFPTVSAKKGFCSRNFHAVGMAGARHRNGYWLWHRPHTVPSARKARLARPKRGRQKKGKPDDSRRNDVRRNPVHPSSPTKRFTNCVGRRDFSIKGVRG